MYSSQMDEKANLNLDKINHLRFGWHATALSVSKVLSIRGHYAEKR